MSELMFYDLRGRWPRFVTPHAEKKNNNMRLFDNL